MGSAGTRQIQVISLHCMARSGSWEFRSPLKKHIFENKSIDLNFSKKSLDINMSQDLSDSDGEFETVGDKNNLPFVPSSDNESVKAATSDEDGEPLNSDEDSNWGEDFSEEESGTIALFSGENSVSRKISSTKASGANPARAKGIPLLPLLGQGDSSGAGPSGSSGPRALPGASTPSATVTSAQAVVTVDAVASTSTTQSVDLRPSSPVLLDLGSDILNLNVAAPAQPEADDDEFDTEALAAFSERFIRPTVPLFHEKITTTVNGTWLDGKKDEILKEAVQAWPCPKNCAAKAMDINKELKPVCNKHTKFMDIRLSHAQELVAKAYVPIARIFETAVKRKVSPEGQLSIRQAAAAAMSMLAAVSDLINQERRIIVKDNMAPFLRHLAYDNLTLGSQLFGRDFCKKVEESKKIRDLRLGKELPNSRKRKHNGGELNEYVFTSFSPDKKSKHDSVNSQYGSDFQYDNFTVMNMSLDSEDESGLSDEDLTVLDMSLENDTEIDEIDSQHDGKICKNVRICNNTAFFPCREGPLPEKETENGNLLPKEEGRTQKAPRAAKQGTRQVPEEGPGQPWQKKQRVTEVSGLPIINIGKYSTFRANRAVSNFNAWKSLSTDKNMLNEIRGYKIKFASAPVQVAPCFELRLNSYEKKKLDEEIEKLLTQGVVKKVEPVEGQFISNVFLRPKHDPGDFRMILNVKQLNKHLVKNHFKMDTLDVVLKLVTPNCFFTSLDFKSAYYTFAIHEDHRKYLRFSHDGQLYEFQCLAQGLSSCCFYFTKVMKLPLTVLRERHDVTISNYLDDTIIIEESYMETVESTAAAANLFQELGFMLSESKSVTQPSHTIEYLGVVIDSVEMIVYLTERRIKNIQSALCNILAKEEASIREVCSVLGALESTRYANPLVGYYTKPIEIEKIAALRKAEERGAKNKWNAFMPISQNMRDLFTWWMENVEKLEAPIIRGNPNWTMKSDASKKGWGVYLPSSGVRFGGRFTTSEARSSINVLEMKAVLFGLKAACRVPPGSHVKVISDNMTTVHCITKMGSCRAPKCNAVARQIWDFAIQNKIWITAAHLAGKLNVEADEESRNFNDDIEISLNKNIFQHACSIFGRPEMDMFATRLNNKLPRYCAWKPDPGAEIIDAFTVSWEGMYIYAFPPFNLIGRVLQKIKMDKCSALMVIPAWSTKGWYTQVRKMLIGKPVKYKISDNIFSDSHRSGRPVLQQLGSKQQVWLCRLSGAP